MLLNALQRYRKALPLNGFVIWIEKPHILSFGHGTGTNKCSVLFTSEFQQKLECHNNILVRHGGHLAPTRHCPTVCNLNWMPRKCVHLNWFALTRARGIKLVIALLENIYSPIDWSPFLMLSRRATIAARTHLAAGVCRRFSGGQPLTISETQKQHRRH